MRRKTIVFNFLIIVALFSITVVSADGLNQETPSIDSTVAKRAKMRVGPGTEWATIGYAEAGENVRLDGRAPYSNLWVRATTSDGRIGWIFGELIATPAAELQNLPVVWDGTPLSAPPPTPAPEVAAADVPPDPQNLPSYDVVSNITSRAHEIFIQGQSLGNRADVFSKVGDSITVSPYFLYPFGLGSYNLHSYSELQAAVNFFTTTTARDNNNSFTNSSLAAYNGITTAGILDPNSAWTQICQQGETPLECEYRVVKPSIALIMLGTNDVASIPLDVYRDNLRRIVQITVDRGIIPVLSLIPTREGYENSIPAYNQVIADTASAFSVPLWNFGSALHGLENNGLSDGIHPSSPPGNGPDDFGAAADFTADNLRYGYTVRNLTALQVLNAVWRRAIY